MDEDTSNALGNWLRPGMGSVYGMGYDQGGGYVQGGGYKLGAGSGGGTFGSSGMNDPFTGKPFSGSLEEYLDRVKLAQKLALPGGHTQSSGPTMSPDQIRQRTIAQIRALGNDPSAYIARLDAVNNGQIYKPQSQPQQLAGFGFNGQSFQGMGTQGDALQNQLGLLLGKK